MFVGEAALGASRRALASATKTGECRKRRSSHSTKSFLFQYFVALRRLSMVAYFRRGFEWLNLTSVFKSGAQTPIADSISGYVTQIEGSRRDGSLIGQAMFLEGVGDEIGNRIGVAFCFWFGFLFLFLLRSGSAIFGPVQCKRRIKCAGCEV